MNPTKIQRAALQAIGRAAFARGGPGWVGYDDVQNAIGSRQWKRIVKALADGGWVEHKTEFGTWIFQLTLYGWAAIADLGTTKGQS